MSTRTGQAAIDYALGRVGNGPPPPHGMEDSGLCLKFTREVFNVPAVYASAIDAWNAASGRHDNDRNIPNAVPVWFWSSSPYRHIAFYAGEGIVVVTSYNDDVRTQTMAQMESTFGPYMGWAETLNGYNVYTPGSGGGGSGFLMALTDDQQANLYARIVNLDQQVTGADGFVPSVASRVVNVDRQLTGADGLTPSLGSRIINTDRQTTGADGFSPSIAENVNDIERAVSGVTRSAVPWQIVLAFAIAVAIVLGLFLALAYDARDGVLGASAALFGAVVTWVATTLRRSPE